MDLPLSASRVQATSHRETNEMLEFESDLAGDGLNCMEVWGGKGATTRRLNRPGLDVWVWSQSSSCSEAGGSDLHLLSSCASGRITRMLLADICGYGSIYGEIAAELRELMKKNVNSIRQRQLVKEMSGRLREASEKGGYASALISTYFSPTRSYTVCNAGHPPPLHFSRAQQKWSPLAGTSESESEQSGDQLSDEVLSVAEYQQFSKRLEVGDLVLSYSNIFTECRREDGTLFGVQGLLDCVGQADAKDPGRIVDALAQRLTDNTDSDSEDATLLLCRVSAKGVRLKDNLMAPFRLLTSVNDKTEL